MGFHTPDRSAADAVLEMLERGELSIVSGSRLAEFEARSAAFWGNSLGMAFSSGTAAIHASLYALGVGPGDEVIVPTYGFHAMVTPVLLLGGTPVFCDVSAESLCAEVEDIDRVRTSRTKGVIVLYPWGNPAELESLRHYTTAEGMFLLGDASHAHGATFRQRPLGTYAEITCASYGKGKLLTGGELGGATTDSAELWDRMAVFCHVNRVPAGLRTSTYRHLTNSVGPKYRPHALALPIALAQMDTYTDRLTALLANIAELVPVINTAGTFALQQPYPGASRVYWKLPVVTRTDPLPLFARASSLGLALERDHYSPLLHQDRNYRDHFRLPSCAGQFPKAESVTGRIVQVPATQLSERRILEGYCELFRAADETR